MPDRRPAPPARPGPPKSKKRLWIAAGVAVALLAAGTFGGVLFGRLGMNRSLWLFGIAGAAGNLAYWLVARSGVRSLEQVAGAVLLENLSSGLVGTAFVALLMSLCNPRFSATQYALLSGVYAISSKVLAAPSGLLVKLLGWEHFFLLSAAAAVPAFLLMVLVTPWREEQARGAYRGTEAAD